jgi:aminoglycoside phosphotransferase (APT) family kinase protein
MTESQKFEQLAQKMLPHSKLRRAWALKGGISAEMTALEIERPNGQITKVIVRQPGTNSQFKLLQLLHTAGLQTPQPLHFGQPDDIFPEPYLIIEYIEGEMEFSPVNPNVYIRQFAAQLAQIHQVSSENADLSFLPQQTMGCAEMRRKQSADMNESLHESRIRQTLTTLWPLQQSNKSVLLHGDYWPGNTLWRVGQLVAVIDWEDAKCGDPLIDLALSRLDIVWIFGIEAMRIFTDHYLALTAVNTTNLPYWELCAALRFIRLAGADLAEWAAFYPPFGRYDITEQTIRDHYHYFISQALGQL